MKDLTEKLIISIVHADAVTKGQSGIESKALNVWPDADLLVRV